MVTRYQDATGVTSSTWCPCYLTDAASALYCCGKQGYDYKPGEDLPTEDFEASVSQRGDESEAYTEEDAYAENRQVDAGTG